MVSFAYPTELAVIADVCQSFTVDNGAFTTWKKGREYDREAYYQFITNWHRHPAFDWCLIPDVIDGDEAANDELLSDWPEHLGNVGVPVWHLHESIDRLTGLAFNYTRVALGSSGQYQTPGTQQWWGRIAEAMNAITECGRPVCKLHGLRMLDPAIFTRLPLASADSTNAVINHKHANRFGMYKPPSKDACAHVIALRIEAHQSAQAWISQPIQRELLCAY